MLKVPANLALASLSIGKIWKCAKIKWTAVGRRVRALDLCLRNQSDHTIPYHALPCFAIPKRNQSDHSFWKPKQPHLWSTLPPAQAPNWSPAPNLNISPKTLAFYPISVSATMQIFIFITKLRCQTTHDYKRHLQVTFTLKKWSWVTKWKPQKWALCRLVIYHYT